MGDVKKAVTLAPMVPIVIGVAFPRGACAAATGDWGSASTFSSACCPLALEGAFLPALACALPFGFGLTAAGALGLAAERGSVTMGFKGLEGK